MLTFRDVARTIETNAVTTALRAAPLEASLHQSLTRAGGPQNLLTPNHNPDTPRLSPDGSPLILLRANSIPIGTGALAP